MVARPNALEYSENKIRKLPRLIRIGWNEAAKVGKVSKLLDRPLLTRSAWIPDGQKTQPK